jgi:DNA-binding NarL/FixJ family response regulator
MEEQDAMSNRADNATNHPHRPRRLALVDADVNQHHCVREHFTAQEAGWRVDTYASAAEAWKGISAAPPHVVLMAISPSAAAGMGCIRSLKAHLPHVPVVMFTAQTQPGLLLQSLTAGARGYLIKPLSPAELLPHLHKVLGGGLALCGKAEQLLLERLHALGGDHSALGLSQREQQLMFCLCQHRSDKGCAEALGISESTVAVHLRSVFKKLGVHDRTAAIRGFLEFPLGGGENEDWHRRAYHLFTTFAGLPFRQAPAQMSPNNELGQATMRNAPTTGKLSREGESSARRSLCSPLEKHEAVANVSKPRTVEH